MINDGAIIANSVGPAGIGSSVGKVAGSGLYLHNGTNTFIVSTGNEVQIDDTIAGDGTLLQTGPGTLKLTAVNPFTGVTEVSDGTIILDGSLDGPVVTSVTGVLSGTGVINGLLNNGATVSPGEPTGTLTVNGNYSQTGTLLINAQNAANTGKLVVNGTAELGGTLSVSILPGEQFEDGDQFIALESTSPIEGTFAHFITENFPSDLKGSFVIQGDQVIVLISVNLMAPQNLTGRQICNVFLTQTEFVNQIVWNQSPSQEVVSYFIYRNGVKIKTVRAADPLLFNDHNQRKGVPVKYAVRAVDALGNIGPAAVVVVPIGC